VQLSHRGKACAWVLRGELHRKLISGSLFGLRERPYGVRGLLPSGVVLLPYERVRQIWGMEHTDGLL